MEYRNITLSVPKDILRKVKVIAANKDTSVSALLTDVLADLVRQDDVYTQARSRHTSMLREAPDLGTGGYVVSPREALHERKP